MPQLPPAKGTYILVLTLARHSFFPVIGPFRNVDLPAGYYAYVGSAFGAGRATSPRSAPSSAALPVPTLLLVTLSKEKS
jgi:hypothetical protein